MWTNSARIMSSKDGNVGRNDKTSSESIKQFAMVKREEHEARWISHSRKLGLSSRKAPFPKSTDNSFAGCADGWGKFADYHKSMRENNGTYETNESWEASTTRENDAAKGRRDSGISGTFLTTVGGSDTIPTRQHPELGQAHRARMEHVSTQRVAAGQAGSSPKHQHLERFVF